MKFTVNNTKKRDFPSYREKTGIFKYETGEAPEKCKNLSRWIHLSLKKVS
jgi:hypothetical protein